VTQPLLFTPITIRETTFRNRLWVAPMCQYSVLEQDGVPRAWHLMHLGSIAAGGAGLVIVEATGVSPEGRISPRDVGIWNDEQLEAWKPIVAFVKSHGAVAGIQLEHAGRKSSTYPGWGSDVHGTVPASEGGWEPLAPSAIPFTGYATPTALDDAGIDKVVADFVAAGRRAIDAGFDLVELHAAHGYLLHQFLSPLSNQRTDAYGGSLENRARLLLRIVTELRAELGATIPIFVRFSATDWTEGGWDESQTAAVSEWARAAGADFFDISTGGNIAGATIPLSPGYQVPFAAYVRENAGVEVSAVGLITSAEQAEEVLQSGKADVVMMAREILRDPHFPLRAAFELGAEIDYWPAQYERAIPRAASVW
jgi:2,4-dienoyl-CoA reductase-like NADH-dependent reductase (Old Yellow Enzyme family)